jgi:hypothetical protein
LLWMRGLKNHCTSFVRKRHMGSLNISNIPAKSFRMSS